MIGIERVSRTATKSSRGLTCQKKPARSNTARRFKDAKGSWQRRVKVQPDCPSLLEWVLTLTGSDLPAVEHQSDQLNLYIVTMAEPQTFPAEIGLVSIRPLHYSGHRLKDQALE